MSHAEQLEQESERTRAQIADTLDELRASMTPGHVLDQLADRVSDGAAAAFARNLKDQTVNNPLPVALIGAGLAWLMLSPRNSNGMRSSGERVRNAASDAAENVRGAADSAARTASGKSSEWSEKASRLGNDAGQGLSSTTERARQAGADAAGAIGDAAGSAADAARQSAAQTAASVRETAGSIADSTRESAAQAADVMRETAGSMADSMQRTASTVSESARTAGQRTLQSGGALLDFCREQPMVLAGLGLAVGAVIGALLPTNETEDQLMGEASDRVKERAQDLASEQYDKAKNVGERALDAAKDEAVKQANKPEKTGDLKDQREGPAGEVKADSATVVPSDQSELERRGQPWTAENAPV